MNQTDLVTDRKTPMEEFCEHEWLMGIFERVLFINFLCILFLLSVSVLQKQVGPISIILLHNSVLRQC
jgi:hypothetical protein